MQKMNYKDPLQVLKVNNTSYPFNNTLLFKQIEIKFYLDLSHSTSKSSTLPQEHRKIALTLVDIHHTRHPNREPTRQERHEISSSSTIPSVPSVPWDRRQHKKCIAMPDLKQINNIKRQMDPSLFQMC